MYKLQARQIQQTAIKNQRRLHVFRAVLCRSGRYVLCIVHIRNYVHKRRFCPSAWGASFYARNGDLLDLSVLRIKGIRTYLRLTASFYIPRRIYPSHFPADAPSLVYFEDYDKCDENTSWAYPALQRCHMFFAYATVAPSLESVSDITIMHWRDVDFPSLTAVRHIYHSCRDYNRRI